MISEIVTSLIIIICWGFERKTV